MFREHTGVVAIGDGPRDDNRDLEVGDMQRTIDDDDLIGFELVWFQRGGGPAAKIREEFGLGDVEFFTRLRTRLDETDGSMPQHVVDQMKAVCRKRLWLARAS